MICPGVSFGLNNHGWKRKLLCVFLDQMFWLLHPLSLSIQSASAQIMNEMMLKSRHIDERVYRQNVDNQEKLLMYLKMYKRLELNLETILQMALKIILLALVQSETRTEQGLLTVFERSDFLGIPANILIISSVGLSFLTFTLAQTDCLAGSRVYFPLKSRIMIGCSVILAVVKRVFSVVLFFSPCLGLFNLLRHFQG